jgi:dimethylhistidine N-methyltransferase
MLDAAFTRQDITGIALEGLTASPKTLPPKLLYDAEGVRLFEAITCLPEYYLTRTERALLAQVALEIAALASPGSVLVEYGASDEVKALRLIDAAPARFTTYLPIDVAEGALADMAARLRVSRPALHLHPFCADFLRPIVLPASVCGHPRFGFFPGSTIGNLDPAMARLFLAEAARTLGPAAWLVIGVDLRKDPAILVPAYDDASGVTAAFNLNLLHRLNREAAADFRPERFAHRAIWNEQEGRIEMHLQSLERQTAHLAGKTIRFERGETIHTENSYKHTVEGFRRLARDAGWQPGQVWTDEAGLFSIHALRSSG